MYQFHCKAVFAKLRSKEILTSNTGTGFFSDGVNVLMVVVVGALLLGAVYALFGDTIIPTVKQKIVDMFNYNG
ncbi:MAG: hypothetical protein E7512_12015 [[Clostridium] sporosphaeroides]|uniref:Uncharacterized protein n=1 Tax=Faecalispora sporosphaeroides TaxID=1549 RepID=A0A928KWR3_9FIRM|nr:hypothetical protein [Faecalispora sporosphaeroides]